MNVPRSTPPSKLLTRKETASLLRIKPDTLAHWLLRGTESERLHVVRVGGRCMYRESEVLAILDGQRPARSRSKAS